MAPRSKKSSAAAAKPAPKARRRAPKGKTSKVALATVEVTPKKVGKARYLVVVESPAKAKTIKKYLGTGYTVKASVGHVKDLPKSKMGVDIDKGFRPEYQVVKGKEKVLEEIKKQASGADKIFLATDPDREGEAIAWHLSEEIGHPHTYRVMFNEITKKAILAAIEHPGSLNRSNYDSQQARRILDRLVGYQISPILWNKVQRGLSAGRVQSVAVRLVVEREAEIKAFVPQEYWTLDALLEAAQPPPFKARLSKLDGKKAQIADKAQSDALVAELSGQDFVVAKVDKRERRRNPPAPFITSKLQQEAANRLYFTAKKTMTLAQRLYEGVELGEEGQTALITYMRTDSVRLSADAVEQVRGMIRERFGIDYLPAEAIVYKSKKSAQDAHEAIRPTSLEYPPERVRPFLEPDMLKLYELIWNRFIACQMNPAVYDQTSADITAGRATFRATGSTLKFPGYLAVYGAGLTPEEEAEAEKAKAAGEQEESTEEAPWQLPTLTEGEKLRLDKLLPEQHFTQPPPRFSEATLVKELEEKGIGRPSTYAAILSTIQDKKYVEKLEGRFHPTELGKITTEELVKAFPNEMDVAFTAGMEERLDQISEGEVKWKQVLTDFWGPFKEHLARAEVNMRDVKREEIKTELKCEKCGSEMVIRWGKMGRFLACSGYNDPAINCKNTKDFKEVDGKIVVVEEETTDEKCDKCGRPMVVKRGRFGRFLACSGYPECKSSKPLSIGVNCPECKVGYLSERRSKRGKIFFGCNRYPECKFAAWDRPLPQACPQCQSPYLLQKYSKREGPFIACPNKECGYRRSVEEGAPAETALPAAAGTAVPGLG
ncbi:MAG: type I DNA topoisomerase [Myxococcota bacterium]